MSFVISGIAASRFQPLFGLDADALQERGVIRQKATSAPGFPCRVSLQDASVGESVLLLNFVSHAVNTPYRSSFAIYVREGVVETAHYENCLPPVLQQRPIALRFFDARGLLIGADLCLGGNPTEQITRGLQQKNVAYLHAHNAAHGCFAAEIRRPE